MDPNLITNTYTTIATARGPQMTAPNTLNPVQLALATKCYNIQSAVLHIPDCIGFFSPGPPRLLVFQGRIFAELLFSIVFEFLVCGFLRFMLWCRPDPKPNGNMVLFISRCRWLMGAAVVLVWVLHCFDKRRRPGYKWPDWAMESY